LLQQASTHRGESPVWHWRTGLLLLYRVYRSRPMSRRQRKDLIVLAHIREQFRLSLGSYGRPRMTEVLKELGLGVGHRRIGRLMRQNGISVKRTRKRKVLRRSSVTIAYISRHWDGLQVFLTDGRVEIDNNPVERTIRPIALNRKNALFAGHDEGGKNWGRIASLIETCKLNGVEPFACLKATLEAIASGHPAEQIDDLMPWAFNKASS